MAQSLAGATQASAGDASSGLREFRNPPVSRKSLIVGLLVAGGKKATQGCMRTVASSCKTSTPHNRRDVCSRTYSRRYEVDFQRVLTARSGRCKTSGPAEDCRLLTDPVGRDFALPQYRIASPTDTPPSKLTGSHGPLLQSYDRSVFVSSQ